MFVQIDIWYPITIESGELGKRSVPQDQDTLVCHGIQHASP